MAKTVRFLPINTPKGWRVNIPAKYSPTGKRQQLHYRTQREALAATVKLKEEKEVFGTQARAIAPSLAEQAQAAAELIKPFGITILEAVQIYVKMEKKIRASVPIETAIEKFKASRDDLSASQATAYRLRGEKLIDAFAGRLMATITAEELQANLEATTGGPGAFNQNVRLLRSLWKWCAKEPRLWCEESVTKQLEPKRVVSKPTEVLTSKQAAALMAAAVDHQPDTVPAFAIALFTGMRQAEISRLTIEDFSADGIRVPALSAKTKKRRFIHMVEPLAAWLAAYPIGENVCPANWTRKERYVRRMAGFKVWSDMVKASDTPTPPDDFPEWPDNALRHTAATMALCLGKPIETLVFEHGHAGGLEMLRRHYVGAMTKAEALKIWAMRPEGAKEPQQLIAV